MSAPTDRRAFLRGFAKLPLIGGSLAIIGAPSAPVSLVQAATLSGIDDPRERARFAWEAFTAAMDELTAEASGWRIIGAGNVRPLGRYGGATYLRLAEVHLAQGIEERCPNSIVERGRDIALDPAEEAIIRAREPIRRAVVAMQAGGRAHG